MGREDKYELLKWKLQIQANHLIISWQGAEMHGFKILIYKEILKDLMWNESKK